MIFSGNFNVLTGHWKQSCDFSFSLRAAADNLLLLLIWSWCSSLETTPWFLNCIKRLAYISLLQVDDDGDAEPWRSPSRNLSPWRSGLTRCSASEAEWWILLRMDAWPPTLLPWDPAAEGAAAALTLRSTEPLEDRLSEATGGLFREAVSNGVAREEITTAGFSEAEARATRNGLLTVSEAMLLFLLLLLLLLEVSALMLRRLLVSLTTLTWTTLLLLLLLASFSMASKSCLCILAWKTWTTGSTMVVCTIYVCTLHIGIGIWIQG